MIRLLDTDVLVDCLRGWPAAEQWLRECATEPFAIPGPVAMELICGCPNQGELERTKDFLSRFAVLWPGEEEFALAYELLLEHRLSSGLSIPDCIIAAQALKRAARLHSFNQKHFDCIAGLDVQPPYVR